MSKERSVLDINRDDASGQMSTEKRRIRKQVIAILSDVLDHR